MTTEKSELTKQVENEVTEILRDLLDDNKRIIKRLQATIVLLVILLVGSFCYYQYNLRGFMDNFDYEDTITTTTSTTNDNKTYAGNSSINASIDNIKVNTNTNK